jgi:hypothetical protein
MYDPTNDHAMPSFGDSTTAWLTALSALLTVVFTYWLLSL